MGELPTQVPQAPAIPCCAQASLPSQVPDRTAEQRSCSNGCSRALVGLIDGSLSTLAPIFAVALATKNPHYTFIAGLATAIAAGISMAYSEGLSDTGELTGRGPGLLRGAITGLATFCGGILHALRLPSFHTAVDLGARGRRRRTRRARLDPVAVPPHPFPDLGTTDHARRCSHRRDQHRPRHKRLGASIIRGTSNGIAGCRHRRGLGSGGSVLLRATTQHAYVQAFGKTGATGLEPATSGVTGRRSNQLNYAPGRAPV